MLSKKLIKDIQSLSLKKLRDEQGLFIAEGPKIVEELIQVSPSSVEAVYATEEWIKQNQFTNAIEVSAFELEKISQLKTPNKVLAVIRQFKSPVPISAAGFILYLDAVQDPGNFGTIIRIADWFGIKQIVCSTGCADLYNPKVVQSTMASIARVNIFYDEDDNWLSQQSQTIYAASLHGEALQSFDKTGNGILIIGNESKGIRPAFNDLATKKITIPRKGEAESLNAAVAAGIILSHLLN